MRIAKFVFLATLLIPIHEALWAQSMDVAVAFYLGLMWYKWAKKSENITPNYLNAALK